MGGNKARKLEFVLADAQIKGADVLITTGSSQSNFALQMAAAGRKLGMDSILVLFKGQHPEVQGNHLLNKILGAEVRIVEGNVADLYTSIIDAMNELADELRKKGRNPYIIPAGATTPLGTIGWVAAAQEVSQQINQLGIGADYLFVPSGGGSIHVGLILGNKYNKIPLKVAGATIAFSKEECVRRFIKLGNDTAELIKWGVRITEDDLVIYDDYLGDGYGIPTKECIEAIRMVARTEGFFLDPVYTGKTMAGLIDLVRKGVFTSKDTVIFWHTGGNSALFAYHGEMLS